MTTKKAGLNILSLEDVLKGGDNPYTELEVPELSKDGNPGVLLLKPLPAGDVFAFANAKTEKDEQKNEALMLMISKAVVNADGSPMFPSSEAVEKIKLVSIRVFNRLVDAVNSMSGIGQKEAEGKDSAPSQPGDSPTS